MQHTNLLLLFVFVFVFSFFLVFLLTKNAIQLGLVDIPNERSAHKNITPRGAGIGFIAAVIFSPLLLDYSFFLTHKYIFLSFSLVLFAGILDDKIEISPKVKLIFIFLASLLLFIDDIYIDYLGSYFGYDIFLPTLLIFPFTLFSIAGFTNALNLMDGLDGLAGSVALVMFIAFFTIGWIHDDELILKLSGLYIGAIIPFLIFNWNPAKIFMGDSGSLTLGFSIALLSILSLKYVTPTAVLFLLALPIFDTFIVMRRRIQRGQSPFSADKTHLHHLMYQVKLDVAFTVKILITIQVIFSIMWYQLQNANDTLTLILFLLFFYIFLKLFDQRLRYRKKSNK